MARAVSYSLFFNVWSANLKSGLVAGSVALATATSTAAVLASSEQSLKLLGQVLEPVWTPVKDFFVDTVAVGAQSVYEQSKQWVELASEQSEQYIQLISDKLTLENLVEGGKNAFVGAGNMVSGLVGFTKQMNATVKDKLDVRTFKRAIYILFEMSDVFWTLIETLFRSGMVSLKDMLGMEVSADERNAAMGLDFKALAKILNSPKFKEMMDAVIAIAKENMDTISHLKPQHIKAVFSKLAEKAEQGDDRLDETFEHIKNNAISMKEKNKKYGDKIEDFLHDLLAVGLFDLAATTAKRILGIVDALSSVVTDAVLTEDQKSKIEQIKGSVDQIVDNLAVIADASLGNTVPVKELEKVMSAVMDSTPFNFIKDGISSLGGWWLS